MRTLPDGVGHAEAQLHQAREQRSCHIAELGGGAVQRQRAQRQRLCVGRQKLYSEC